MTNRKLTLKREMLSVLDSDDMQAVMGGSGWSCGASCLEPQCYIDISPSVKPTCQYSICPSCPA